MPRKTQKSPRKMSRNVKTMLIASIIVAFVIGFAAGVFLAPSLFAHFHMGFGIMHPYSPNVPVISSAKPTSTIP